MAGGEISINSESAKAFKNRFMELKLKNIGPFSFKHLILRSPKSVYVENSAGGKTTIARVLNAFLTGRVDTSLLKHKSTSGNAILEFNNKTYTFYISREVHKVDKIFDAEYADYLVLTENTPLYGIYVSPDRMSLDFLVSKFVSEPMELRKLEGELYRLKSESVDYDKMIKGYEETAKKYEEDLAKVEKELKEIEEKLAKWKEYENIKVILKKREKEGELKTIEEILENYEKERNELLAKLENMDYEELKLRRKQIADELERLYRMRRLYEEAKHAFELIKNGLLKLKDSKDVIYELYTPLFGQPLDPESIETYIDDCNASIEEVTSKYTETSQKIKELEKERDELDKQIGEYVKTHEQLSQLEVKIEKLKKRERELEYEIAYLQRKVEEITKEKGKTEEDLIKEYASLEDINKLMARKNELLKEKEKLKTYIKSFKEAAEKARRQKEWNKELHEKYEEIKKRYSSLKYTWQKQRKLFKDTFLKAFREAFRNISIPDFDPKEMKIERPPHTYSESERFYMAIAYQYALVKALNKIGREIPLVIIDLIASLDKKYLKEILQLYKESGFNVIIFKTRSDEIIGGYDINEYLKRIEGG